MESARAIAYKILKNAATGATYSNIAVDNALKKYQLSDLDRGFVTAVVMGVTERELTLDHIIDRLASDPEKIDSDTRVLLRLGIYQLYCLDKIPDYAAVNESVDLAPRRSRGFVNAILRSFLRARDNGKLDEIFPNEKDDAIAHLSVKYSFPKAFCERFVSIYGFGRTKNILDIFNRAPALTLRINTLKISREEYAGLLDEKRIEYTLSENLPNAIKLDKVAFSALPGFDDGYFFIQDEASQICVEALGAEAGDVIIDTCSCPGSKAFGSAIKMKNEGKIHSFDLHASKLKLIDFGADRLGINVISAAVRDGRQPDESLFGKADRVLCDVPCSGLGVVAKKPEIRYKDLSDLERLPEIQYAILEASASYLKCDGILVYSTCTVLPEENGENVKRFLSAHPEFEPIDFAVGEKRSSGGMLDLSPDRDGTDGFFVAKMRKIK